MSERRRDPNYVPKLALQRERSWLEQTKENLARSASSYAEFATVGMGQYASPDMFDFGCTFETQPYASYGFALDGDQLGDGNDDDASVLPIVFPRCSGGVWRWEQTPQGYYTGAWVYMCVDVLGEGAPAVGTQWLVDHSFTFSGLQAMKKLPAGLIAG